MFDSIEEFYNQERRHSYVDGKSPGAYERAYWDRAEALAAYEKRRRSESSPPARWL